MRLPLLLCFVPFAIASVAHAQSAAPSICAADTDCAGPSSCIDKVCVPTSPAPPGGLSTFVDRFVLSIGLGSFGEVFPVSSVKVPGTSRGQFNLLGGIRFMIGTRLPKRVRVLGVIELGYASSGYFPNRAADGLMEGAGLEVSLDYFETVQPFIRFMYNALVVPLRENNEGKLAFNSYFVSAGVRFFIFDVHLSVGRDFAGGVSPGIGFGLNWLH